ncbi:hypothetical protein HY095_02470 [Candidatus Micrarchaeota archaeon]|nr:hypothetical protein [Candidatus Micrarchaeota archaeon]
MEKTPKYKVVLSKQVKKQLNKVSKKDRKMLEAAFKKLSQNPFLGKPVDCQPFKPMPWEKCRCGRPLVMLWDKNADEVDVSCANEKCETSFWATKKEIDVGRANRLNQEVHSISRKKHAFSREIKKCKCHIRVAGCPCKDCKFAWCEKCESYRDCNCKDRCTKSTKQANEDSLVVRKNYG